MEKALSHYGVLGMKWGVRRDQKTLDRQAGRTYTKAPEGGSVSRQLKVRKAKEAVRTAKGLNAKREAKDELSIAKKRLEEGYKEYRAFEKAMYKKSKTGKTLKPFEQMGLKDYELRKKVERGKIVTNSLLAAGVLLFSFSTIRR